jgi:16S rRNA C967 or C1407 C5-methylase (RsmB/RsmF family)
LLKVASKLFEDENQKLDFIQALVAPVPKPTALIWFVPKTHLGLIEIPLPSIYPDWVSLVPADSHIGRLPEHERGDFYCLDLSSVYAMQSLLKLLQDSELDSDSVVVDLCASPGGKSIFAARALRPAQLICNEVSGPRIPALLSNLKRCKILNATATQADPGYFSKFNQRVADLVLVDAPCSGQSLLAKGDKGFSVFSKPMINLNVGRQRRILAEASKIVCEGAYILYSTCTFCLEENEKNIEWFLKKFPRFTEISSGRMWPQDGLGAGSFYSLLKHDGERGSRQAIELEDIKNWPIFTAA